MIIDPMAPEPAYQQLAAILRQRIASGEYKPRQPIPSITRLVGDTGLAVATIRKAVDVLEAEGLVVVVPGRGTFVK